MKESVLKNYFEKKISATTLNLDVNDSQVKTGFDTSCLDVEIIESMEEFEINSKHLIQLAEDTVSNRISPRNLATIAFALEGSDFFTWNDNTIDGQKVGRAIFEWDNEEINYPINKQNLTLWIEYLRSGKYSLKT